MTSSDWTLESDEVEARVAARGAELVSLVRKRDGVELLWPGDPAVWDRRAPILFPIVGRLRGDRYRHGGRAYKLPQHGFAQDRAFRRVRGGGAVPARRLVLALASDAETRDAYPFEFELAVAYVLSETRLAVQYRVRATGDRPILFSLGAHPGFRCPVLPGERFEEYEILFERRELAARRLVERGLLTGEVEPLLERERTLPLDYPLFERGAIVLSGLASRWVALRRSGGETVVAVDLAGWPHLGIWTKPGAPFVCLEPWHGIADRGDGGGELAEKEGIVRLPPGGEFRAGWGITVA